MTINLTLSISILKSNCCVAPTKLLKKKFGHYLKSFAHFVAKIEVIVKRLLFLFGLIDALTY